MQNDYNFLKRRVDDAAFNKWLYRNIYEKNLSSGFTFSLAEEYKRKYEHLLIKYSCAKNDEDENISTIWIDEFPDD